MKNVIRAMLIISLCCLTVVSEAKRRRGGNKVDLPTASDDYGYTAERSIRMGYKDRMEENVALCRYFIDNLKTDSGQSLNQLPGVAHVFDPIHKPVRKTFYGGIEKRSRVRTGGFLDRYVLVTSDELDTIKLYFDVYRIDTLRVPKGLKFVGKTKKILPDSLIYKPEE